MLSYKFNLNQLIIKSIFMVFGAFIINQQVYAGQISIKNQTGKIFNNIRIKPINLNK